MHLDELRSRVESMGFRTSNQADGFRSQCPCCKTSRKDKLSATRAQDRVLLRCMGGCPTSAVVDSLGITVNDLFVDASQTNPTNGKVNSKSPKLHDSVDSAVKGLRWHLSRARDSVGRQLHTDLVDSRWAYHEENGKHVATVVRFDFTNVDGKQDKTYRQMRRVGDQWQNKSPEHRYLYRLPELAEHDEIWLFEGEGCADAGWSIGLPSTTTLGGCKQAHLADFNSLRGKARVTLCPDTGDDGEHWLTACVKAISALEHPPELRVCRMPFDVSNCDVCDWLEGVETDEDQDIQARLEMLCEAIEPPPAGEAQAQAQAEDQEPPEADAPKADGDSKPDCKVAYQRLTSAELDAANYRVEFLIDRLMVAGQPMVVSGSKKTLKTSLMIDMGITLATRGFFLGKLPASRPCRVAIMTGESGLSTIQETARRIAKAARHELKKIDNLIWSPDLPKFGDLKHMDSLGEFLTADAIEVVMIDPAYLCMPSADAGNLMAQGELLRSMNDVCKKVGAMLVLAHHNTQSSLRTRQNKAGYDPPELEDIAWAGFQEWARQWLLVGRRQKYEPGTGEHALWLNVGGSAGHSALWAVDISEGVYSPDTPRTWKVSIRSGWDERQLRSQKAERAKNEEIRTRENEWKLKLWDTMQRHPDGNTSSGYRDLAGLSGSQMKKAEALLDREGRIETCRVQKANGATYDGIKPKDVNARKEENPDTRKEPGENPERTHSDNTL